jgi:hypothetical protein
VNVGNNSSGFEEASGALASPAMPRSIDVSFTSEASVERVHAAFGDEGYWLGRIAAFGGGIELDSFTSDSAGAITVVTSQDLRHEALPGPLARVYPGTLTVHRYEAWRPIGRRRVSGDIEVTASGAPLSGSATALLESDGRGSRLTFAGTVSFTLPIVGGRIESYLAEQLRTGIADLKRFTDAWIAEHPWNRAES